MLRTIFNRLQVIQFISLKVLVVTLLMVHVGLMDGVAQGDPCLQMQAAPADGSNVRHSKKVELSKLDKSLLRYWRKSNDSKERKAEVIEQQLNKNAKLSNNGAVVYYVYPDPCEPPPTCSVSQPSASNVSRCGAGNVSLYATPGSGGSEVHWYSTASSPAVLFSGSPYVVYVSSSRSYYVSTYDPYTGCESTRRQVSVTINPGLNVYGISGGGYYCPSDPQSFPADVVLDGSQIGVTYALHYNGIGTGIYPKSGTGSPLVWQGSLLVEYPTGSYTIRATNGSCTNDMGTFSINAYDAPTDQPVNGGGQYCNGSTATISVPTTQVGVSYQLRLDGVDVGSPVPGKFPISWSGITQPGTYTVYAFRSLCPTSNRILSTSAVVSFIQSSVTAIITGPTVLCSGESSTLYANTGAGYTYQWKRNGVVVGTSASLPITQGGTYELTVTLDGCSASTSQIVGESTPPTDITDVSGLLISFQNEANLIEVLGSEDATEFRYSNNVSIIDAGGNVTGRRVKLSASTTGLPHAVTVTPYKNGCPGNAYVFNYTVLSATMLQGDGKITMNHAALSQPNPTGYMYLPKHSINQYNGCITNYGPVTVSLVLDLGDTYNLGNYAFTASLKAKITAYSDIPGTELIWDDIPLVIKESSPEQMFRKQITINPALVKFIKVEVSNYNHGGSAAVAEAIRLHAYFTEIDEVNVNNLTVSLSQPANNSNLGTNWEQSFSWNSCSDIPQYVLQLLRVYDQQAETLPTAPTESQWAQALSIQTESTAKSLIVSMAEGTGRYWWRVIPIGNLPGDIANPDNWGQPSTPFTFFYTHPESGVNWIYSRTFTEGNTLSEQVTYANGLQQVVQQQTRIQEENQVVATHSLQDFIGRNALTSLPIPTGLNKLGYLGNLLKRKNDNALYTVADFDADNRLQSPHAAKDLSDYYGGEPNTLNKDVANAEGYPFTRTLFGPDGRVREQSGVGLQHSIVGGKTVKTYYSNPADGELVRLFGVEAPDFKSVQKITTIDANGTASISYQTKDGKIVATALSKSDAPALTKLPSEAPSTTTFYEEINGYDRINSRTISSRKPLFFAQPVANFQVDYKITPAMLDQLCSTMAEPCKTCDYKVELLLHKEGDEQPLVIGSTEIRAGGCSEQNALAWNPNPYPVSILPGINYVLEKRITLENKDNTGKKYIDNITTELETAYRADFNNDPTLTQIKAYLAAGSFSELRTFLLPYYDAPNQQYAVPVLVGSACPEFIYIPEFDVCPNEVVYDATTCKRNGQTFWEYLHSYYPPTGAVDVSQALYFNNLISNTKVYYTQSVFDQMVVNMKNDNGLTCENIWKVWELEVQGYEANINQDLNVDSGNMDGEGSDYDAEKQYFNGIVSSQTYRLLESFLKAMDSFLQEELPEPQTESTPVDMCVQRVNTNYQHFIMRGTLYGKLSSSNTVQPDIQNAYKLVYYDYSNKGHTQALKFYKGTYTDAQMADTTYLPAVPTDFDMLSICDKYKFSKNTEFTGKMLLEADALTGINRIKNKCAQGCRSREEEFRQGIIRSLMIQNPATKIEKYNTYIDPFQDADLVAQGVQSFWVGVLDSTKNVTGFTISLCELESMVEALVQNCITNYCNTTLTVQNTTDSLTGRPVRVYGATEERLKIEKALMYDFEIEVRQSGQTCLGEYDTMDSRSIDESGVQGIDFKQGWEYGAILGSPSNPVDFDKVFTVTNSNSSGIGSFLRALQDAEGYYSMNPSHSILINFNIGFGNKVVSLDGFFFRFYGFGNLTIDGTTQPGHSLMTGAPITISIDNSNGSHSLGTMELLGVNNITFKGIKFIDYGCDQFWIAISGNVQMYSCIINTELQLSNSNNSVFKGNLFQPISFPSAEAMTLYYCANTIIGGSSISERNIFGSEVANSIGGIIFNGNVSNSLIQNNRFINVSRMIWYTGGSNNYNRFSDNLYRFFINPPSASGFHLGTPTPTGTNISKVPPVISDLNLANGKFTVTGTSQPNDFIELFLSRQVFPAKYEVIKTLGVTNVNSSGVWSIPNVSIPNGYSVLATGTDTQNTTSRYSNILINPVTCPSSHSLCFRFTNRKNLAVVVPDSLKNYVYNPQPITCDEGLKDYLSSQIEQQQEQIITTKKDGLRQQYFSQCADPSRLQDKLSITYQTGIHHYTLYYYDRAGNLIRTVPPDGVDLLDVSSAGALTTAKTVLPRHLMVTEYQYNSLGQLVREHSPDGTPKPNNLTDRPLGTTSPTLVEEDTYYTSFIYSSIGLLRFSQNAQQKIDGTYSYTKYDELGRVIEVGQASGFNYNALYNASDEKGKASYPQTGMSQVTRTYYTVALNDASGSDYASVQLPIDPRTQVAYQQRNLRNRVSYAVLDEDGNPATTADNTLTVYSYDPHGNVEWLVQVIDGMSTRATRYEYDLLSGKVTKVIYSEGNVDQLMHQYQYDANNRIKTVLTSTDGELWEREARYEYYLHGPLKRTVVGEDEVQGIDYTYTIHGWLKAINHPYLTNATDPGNDAGSGSLTGRDAFGMALGYYTGDYKHNGSTLDASHASTLTPASGKDLYNGNIAAWSANTAGWKAIGSLRHHGVTGQVFTYDELNRLKTADLRIGTGYLTSNDYGTTYSYSANGNIEQATATHFGGALLDNLTYTYGTYTDPLRGNAVRPMSNRLRQVSDAAPSSAFLDDVEAGQVLDNYEYDAIGNLVRDKQQQTRITWTPYGKVKAVNKTDGAGNPTGIRTEFVYDAAGNRVAKKFINTTTGIVKNHYYVRDASGNIMGVYEKIEQSGTTPEISVLEMPIYGSSRLGRYNEFITLLAEGELPLLPGESRVTGNQTVTSYSGVSYLVNAGATLTLGSGFNYAATGSNSFTVRTGAATSQPLAANIHTRTLKNRQYELTDHLGNVRVVTSDVKLSTLAGTTPQNFEPEVLNINNYYAFGMDMPERTWKAGDKYRYGFNGKEKDDNGEFGSTVYDYGMRIYNPSIGRFFTPDPLRSEYPMLTPYQFAGNTPIWAIDLDGLEPLVASDFKTLNQLKKNLKLEYCYDLVDDKKVHQVTVSQTFWGIHQSHTLSENGGPKQTELSTFWGKAKYAANHPGNAAVLNKINNMSYRKENDQGMAFQDIANAIKGNLKGGGRGTIGNTFLHVTGQAIITSIFGKGYADLAGDIHERDHTALMTGDMTGQNMEAVIDNYVDIINNEWGQRWGEAISKDLGITKDTEWTNDLTSKYLNALQDKISKGMGVKFNKTFTESDDFVKKTTEFINANK